MAKRKKNCLSRRLRLHINSFRLVAECEIDDICTLVKILFTKLDYHSSKDSLEDWKALADCLNLCYHDDIHNKDIDDMLEECWDERSDWWPGYHFKDRITATSLSSHDNDVVLEKSRVAKFLLGKGKFYRLLILIFFVSL